jgi:DNA-binding response OmpR family regulator
MAPPPGSGRALAELPLARRSQWRRYGMNPLLEGLRVMVVDDDPASAKLAAVILRAEGCDVAVASDGEEAEEALAWVRPAVVVLDLVLPVLGGLTLARHLRSKPEHARVIVIAMTILDDKLTEAAARDAGCDAFLGKPFDPAELVGAVETLVKERGR